MCKSVNNYVGVYWMFIEYHRVEVISKSSRKRIQKILQYACTIFKDNISGKYCKNVVHSYMQSTNPNTFSYVYILTQLHTYEHPFDVNYVKGAALVECIVTDSGERELVIDLLLVEQGYHLGTQLFDAIKMQAKRDHCKSISLNSLNDQTVIGFYVGRGFKIDKRERKHKKKFNERGEVPMVFLLT